MTRRTVVLAALMALGAAAPADAAYLYGVTTENRLVTFESDTPQAFSSSTAITGLQSGETVRGLDLRAQTNTLLLLTEAPAASGANLRLRTLDPLTGVAASAVETLVVPSSPSLGFTMDGDVARISTAAGKLFSVSPTGATLDTDDTAAMPALATPGSDLYGLDDQDSRRLLGIARSTGATSAIGPGTGLPGGDPDDTLQFDVAPSGETLVASTSSLHRLDLRTSHVTSLGTLSGFENLLGMAAVNDVFSFSATAVDAAEGSPSAALTVLRAAPFDSAAVQVSLAGSSATGGQDFTGTTQTLTFAPGERSRVVQIALRDDGADEVPEQLTVTLAPVGRSRVANPRAATVTILDDDPAAAPAPAPEQILVPFPVVPPAQALAAGACANPLRGTSGDDALPGTPAGDAIVGGAGADALAGRDGDDCLTGGPGNDWLNGADGRDALTGDAGEDFLLGGRGNDALAGGNGDDRLAGGDGNDTISAGGGSNRVVGGSGADRINTRNGRKDVVDCGGGRDRATIDIRRDKTRACETIPGT